MCLPVGILKRLRACHSFWNDLSYGIWNAVYFGTQKTSYSRNCREGKEEESSVRPVSTGKLNALPHLHLRPIDLVVYKGTFVLLQGYLILRQASRLDAFSGYPFRTWLSCYAVGTTTGPPEVRPSRSSRTRDRPSQISYAHSR